MSPRTWAADRHQVVALLPKNRNWLLGINTVSIGSLSGALVQLREVFRPAIQASAATTVVTQSHLSGNAEPAAEDIALTRRLASAGSLLGFELLDRVELGEDGRSVYLRTRGSQQSDGLA